MTAMSCDREKGFFITKSYKTSNSLKSLAFDCMSVRLDKCNTLSKHTISSPKMIKKIHK